MSRRKAAPKRVILPDPLFGSEMVSKFINVVMNCGKKAVAERIVYGAFQEMMIKLPKQLKEGGQGRDDEEGGGSGQGLRFRGETDIRRSNVARETALEAFERALDNVMPVVEVKSRRVGGSTYQVPIEVRANRRQALGMRWLVDFAAQRNEKTMANRLANELLDAVLGRGGAVKKREDVHRMAKANQAFSHYRW